VRECGKDKGPRQRASEKLGDDDVTIADSWAWFKWVLAAAGAVTTLVVAGKNFDSMASPVYEAALQRFREAKERIRSVRQHTTAATSFQITDEEVIQWTQFPTNRWRWPWLVRRALRWDDKRKHRNKP
jgi:hypothetical protein